MKRFEKILLIILILTGGLVLYIANVRPGFPVPMGNQQFVDLAYSFLHGSLSFGSTARSFYDSSLFQGQFYWPLGPLPAVLLMPFVLLFGLTMMQGYLQFVFVGVIFFLLYRIALKILERKREAVWLSTGYLFATAFIGVAVVPYSWQFAQITATMFMLAAIYEYVYKKRWLYIGIYLALAIAVRLDLILALVFFGGSLFLQHAYTRHKISQALVFASPIAASIVLLLAYNYFRFNNIFDQGYTLQLLADPLLQANRSEAVWGLVHFPANLYYFFLKGPDGIFVPGTQILTFPYLQDNDWGMSIFFTSPLFLWIIKAPFRKQEVMLAGITVLLIACAIFGYYGIGYDQFGYRYALDFYPFLFFILLYAIRNHVSVLLKSIIVLSFIFNLYIIYT